MQILNTLHFDSIRHVAYYWWSLTIVDHSHWLNCRWVYVGFAGKVRKKQPKQAVSKYTLNCPTNSARFGNVFKFNYTNKTHPPGSWGKHDMNACMNTHHQHHHHQWGASTHLLIRLLTKPMPYQLNAILSNEPPATEAETFRPEAAAETQLAAKLWARRSQN